MNIYLVVEFDHDERQVIRTAGLSLGITFPQIHEPTPAKGGKRPDDQREPLRVIAMGDGRAQATWSYEQVAGAVGVMTLQVLTLERESSLDHWLDLHGRATFLEPSQDPTSGYQQYRMLAEVRAGQLADARAALKIFTSAVRRTSDTCASLLVD